MEPIRRREGLFKILLAVLASIAGRIPPQVTGLSSSYRPKIVDEELPDAIFANHAPFKATGKGAVDDTSALRAAFELAISSGRTLVLQGTYKVSGPLVDGHTRLSGALNLHFDGNVIIEIEKTAKRFDTLIHLMVEQPVTSLFTGTGLALKLNGRCACGLVIRYLSQPMTGKLDWAASVEVYEAFNDEVNETTDNYGIAIIGRFFKVKICNPVVVGVRRARAVGESKALAIAGYTGEVTITHPYLAYVAGPMGEADADLLALFPAPDAANPSARRTGTAFVNNGTFIDSQGRSIKLQGRAELTNNTYIRTGKVISMQESCEVDAQFDGVVEIGATYRYERAANGGSPLGLHHVLLSVQHLLGRVDQKSRMERAVIYSEVPIWAAVYINQTERASPHSFELRGFTVKAMGGLSGSVVQRAVVEFDADKILQSAGKMSISVTQVNGAVGAPIIGYNSSSTRFFPKVVAQVSDSINTGTGAALVACIGGRLDLPVLKIRSANNAGWSNAQTQ